MDFCPSCANILLEEIGPKSYLRLYCQTCPYVFDLKRTIVKKYVFQTKHSEEILKNEDIWNSVDQTDVVCQACGNAKAHFFQLQVRPSDEPSTNFFRCANPECKFRWKEDTI